MMNGPGSCCLEASERIIWGARRKRPRSGRRWSISQIVIPCVLLPTHHQAGARLPPEHPPRYAPASRTSAASGRFGETAPKLIDERWNILRCDVTYRAAGVYIQLVRGGGGAAFPGTMASRIRRRAASPASVTRSRAASPATAAARRQGAAAFLTTLFPLTIL
jgi:hypothetical protein